MTCREYIKGYRENGAEENSVAAAYLKLPAFMEQETTVGKKERYNEIIASFKELRAGVFSAEKGLCHASASERGEEFLTISSALYLCTIIDSMDVMAQEVFEHYKLLEGMFKESVKGILKYYDADRHLFLTMPEKAEAEENPVDISATALIAYAISKACRMHVLLEEKYLHIGEDLYRTCVSAYKDEDTEELVMARAEYVSGK